jgi:hypothetical protein
VAVDLPWPREAAALSAPAFVAIKARCLDTFTRSVAGA